MIDPREDQKDTLCIYCRLAVHGNCSWCRDFAPVDGWTIIENPRGGCYVQECPLFEVGRGLPHQIDNDGMLALLEACAVQMRDDYIHGRDYHNKEEDERDKRNEYNALVRESKKYSLLSPKRRKIDAEIRAINRKRIEAWIRGDGGRMLQISDPDALISYLRKQAKIHDTRTAQLLMSV